MDILRTRYCVLLTSNGQEKSIKDTKKTLMKYTQNTKEQESFTNVKTLVTKPVYEFANKKTEKLVTALYMVTDYMEINDSIREKLRLLGVELLSDIYKLSRLLPVDNFSQIDLSLSRIYEIFSLLEIAQTIGYISEMNANILKVEFNNLIEELKSHKTEEKHFPFDLNESMFDVQKNEIRNNSKGSPFSPVFNVKDIKDTNKKTNNLSFRNERDTSKTSLTSADYKKIKEERAEKILSIIKDKHNSPDDGGASIKDISSQFTDCSEKTIQREINDLISKNKIKKVGAKRWSKYKLA